MFYFPDLTHNLIIQIQISQGLSYDIPNKYFTPFPLMPVFLMLSYSRLTFAMRTIRRYLSVQDKKETISVESLSFLGNPDPVISNPVNSHTQLLKNLILCHVLKAGG